MAAVRSTLTYCKVLISVERNFGTFNNGKEFSTANYNIKASVFNVRSLSETTGLD